MKPDDARISELVKRAGTAKSPDVTVGSRYLLYGAGRLGRTMLGALKRAQVEVVGFLDQNAASSPELDNLPVARSDSDEARKLYAQSNGIAVSVYNHHVNLKGIFENLHQLGFDKVYSAPDLARALPKGALHLDYWLDLNDDPVSVHEAAEHLKQVSGFFDEPHSRELFLELAELRLTGNYTMSGARIHSPDLQRQYFPQDLPIDARRMIDCGAYDGDSLRAARQFSKGVERAACFEPDPNNFQKLAAGVRGQSNASDIELFPLAVWNKNDVLGFKSSLEASSALSRDGASGTAEKMTYIQAVRLDDALGSFQPTLIKMDIEAAEPEALQGAARLISESRPQLAICIYHKLRHYWEIPQLIRSLHPSYKLYLRQHGYNGQETVLYALPEGSA